MTQRNQRSGQPRSNSSSTPNATQSTQSTQSIPDSSPPRSRNSLPFFCQLPCLDDLRGPPSANRPRTSSPSGPSTAAHHLQARHLPVLSSPSLLSLLSLTKSPAFAMPAEILSRLFALCLQAHP
ncbi:hypothetical protein AOQ84DRAFT_204068 [Glonium stellatum]|uniref:Uncharacterized protein n=1 Tax=Glonium stellatum TaxID=574774 RepID=A0A8E2ENL8_9PEZI|nr:hypothetical protein AOQ84DRAFT_204068 [Glonium stellatum]